MFNIILLGQYVIAMSIIGKKLKGFDAAFAAFMLIAVFDICVISILIYLIATF